MNNFKLTGLVAAAHTPFNADGTLNLAAVEAQARHFLEQHLSFAFICGSTGESHSLRFEERRQLAQRWLDVTRGTSLQVVVHVGSNCLLDAQELAAHASRIGAPAIAALSPCYFKPATLTDLVAWCAAIANAAPETPFYFYDIPALTHVKFCMPTFLGQVADRIPNFNGIKFTNSDLMSFQQCLREQDGLFDIPWGVDEALLAALAVGAKGAVGSTYGFAAPLYQRLVTAFEKSDLVSAQHEQARSVQLIQLLASYGYLGASKAIMKMLGVDVGSTRMPNPSSTRGQMATLHADLEKLGYFDWIGAEKAQPVV